MPTSIQDFGRSFQARLVKAGFDGWVKSVRRFKTATVAFREPFLDALSPTDRAKVVEGFQNMQPAKHDVRTVIHTLDSPLMSQDCSGLAIRIKGMLPKTKDRTVEPYLSGRGYVERGFSSNGPDVLCSQKIEEDPFGTNTFRALLVEAGAAISMGNSLTDHFLGMGIFNNLSFHDEPVGFTIYSIERPLDKRLLYSFMDRNGDFPNGEKIAFEAGAKFRQIVLDKHIFHLWGHFANIAQNVDDSLRIVDLDEIVRVRTVPSDRRSVFLFVNLSRPLNEFLKRYNYWYESERDEKTWVEMLPHFLLGYFGRETSDFSREIAGLIQDGATIRDLEGLFGVCPHFGSGWVSGSGNCIIQPTINLISGKAREVNLKEYFYDKPIFFRMFYQAIEQMAEEIKI